MRTYYVGLLYAGKVRLGLQRARGVKGWLSLSAAREHLTRGEHVTLIDFEDSAETAVAAGRPRCRRRHAAAAFPLRPSQEPRGELGDLAIAPALDVSGLVILDGVTEALALHGIDMNSNVEVEGSCRACRASGPGRSGGVVLLDHVTKDRESRGRFAIGAQVKLSATDVAYRLEVVEPFARGREGLVKVKVTKDRPGHVRRYAEGDRIADLRLRSDGEGVTVELVPPMEAGAPLRPTGQMERVSKVVEQDPGLSKRAIRAAISGRHDVIDLALELLVSEGFVEQRPDGRANAHHSRKPFREGTHEPDRAHVPTVPQTCPRTPNSNSCRAPTTSRPPTPNSSGYERRDWHEHPRPPRARAVGRAARRDRGPRR